MFHLHPTNQKTDSYCCDSFYILHFLSRNLEEEEVLFGSRPQRIDPLVRDFSAS